MPATSFHHIAKDKAFWVLCVLALLYFAIPLFLGDTFFFRDLGYDFVPQKHLFTTMLKSGRLPLWDEFRHGGQPYLGDLNNSTLYPTNVLYLILPFFTAFTVTIVIHELCALLSSYLLARTCGFCPAASIITALIYGFCGYTLSLINLHGRFLAISLLPLLLWFWHRGFLERARVRWFLLTVVTGVCQVLAGAPEVNVISMLLLLAWALTFPYPAWTVMRKSWRWLHLGTVILGLSLIQLLPTVEMSLQSMRGEGITYEIFSQWSLYPGRLPELIIPNFFGYADRFPYNVFYWGGELGDKGYSYILNIYFGMAAFVFAGIGGLHSARNTPLPRRLRRLLLGILLLSVLLASGRYLPFFRALSQLPCMTIFRYPIKFLLAGILPVSLLAGSAAHRYFDQKTRYAVSPLIIILTWVIGGILCVWTGLFIVSEQIAHAFQHIVFHKPVGELARHALGLSFLHVTVIWLAISLLVTYRRIKPTAWQPWMLAALFAVDLLSAGRRINAYAPQSFFTHTPPGVSLVRQHIGDGRLFRPQAPLPSTIYVEPQDVFDAPPDHIAWLYRWKFEVMSKYLASYYRIPVIFHEDYDLLASKHLMTLRNMLQNVPWQQRLPLLSAGNVTTVLASERLSLPGIELLGDIPNRGKVPVLLYKNHRAARRIEFVPQWKVVSSDTDTIPLLLSDGYDPRRHVVIQQPDVTVFSHQIQHAASPIPDGSSGQCQYSEQNAMLRIHETDQGQRLTVSSVCDGFLVFAEPFSPGWQIRVDGEPAPVFRANLAFSAVFLSSGEHDVTRVYRPRSLTFGIIGSFIVSVWCLVFGIWPIREAKPQTPNTKH